MLVLIADLRVKAGLTSTDTSKDTEILAAYGSALSVLETYLNRKLEHKTETEKFTHLDGYTASLERYPLTHVDSITPSLPYHAEDKTGLLHFDGRVHDHEVTVVYSGGYDDTNVPGVILMALLEGFKSVFDGTGSSTGEIQSITTPDVGTIRFETGGAASGSSAGFGPLSGGMVDLLAAYRRAWA